MSQYGGGLVYQKHNVIVSLVCIDDDASTRSMLKWSNDDYMKNNYTTTIPQVPITKGKNKGELQERRDRGRLAGEIPDTRAIVCG
jgi:hypothetical protein